MLFPELEHDLRKQDATALMALVLNPLRRGGWWTSRQVALELGIRDSRIVAQPLRRLRDAGVLASFRHERTHFWSLQ